METDGSGKDVFKIVKCGSKGLTPTQQRYSTIELECLAIIWAVQKCSFYLRGLPIFHVLTDHRPLEAGRNCLLLAFLWRGITLTVTGHENGEHRILSIIEYKSVEKTYKLVNLACTVQGPNTHWKPALNSQQTF